MPALRVRVIAWTVTGILAVVLSACGAPAPAPSPSIDASSVVTPSPSSRETSAASPRPSVSKTSSTPPRKIPAPLIVIDPGHSGRSVRSREPVTGLRDIDYPNYPEIYETFDVSACVAAALRADGYRVIMTKQRALDTVGLAARAEIANENKADLALSIHNDHSQTSRFEATYDQRGVKDRNGKYHAMYRGVGDHRTVFDRPAVAERSQRYARIIATERTKAQGQPVVVRENSYDGRAPLEPGNLAIVQLLAKVPWVYNEMGARTGSSVAQATSIDSEARYARGILDGVEAAVPLASRVARPGTTTAGLRRCLTTQVEPGPGRYTRPRQYLPLGFG